MVVKPLGPGIFGGMGGGNGGDGGGGELDAQPATTAPELMQVPGQSVLIGASLAAGGVKTYGQPEARAPADTSATDIWQAAAIDPNKKAPVAIPRAHSVPPTHPTMEANGEAKSVHRSAAIVPFVEFIMAAVASRLKCSLAIPSAAKGTSVPLAIRLRVDRCK